MVFGKLFSPEADKTKEKSHTSQSGKSMGSQARNEFDDLESINPKTRLSSNKSEDRRKKLRYTSPDIQEDYDETEGLHSDHDEDKISEEEFSAEFRGAPEWARAMMEYLRKSTTSVRRTCKSLARKVTQVQNDFLLYKDQQEKQLNDFRQSLDNTSEQLETLQREKADLTRKVNGLKKDLEEQIDNMEQYSRKQCLIFMGIKEEREENTDQVILEFCKDNLGITISESQLDRSHRIGPPQN